MKYPLTTISQVEAQELLVSDSRASGIIEQVVEYSTTGKLKSATEADRQELISLLQWILLTKEALLAYSALLQTHGLNSTQSKELANLQQDVAESVFRNEIKNLSTETLLQLAGDPLRLAILHEALPEFAEDGWDKLFSEQGQQLITESQGTIPSADEMLRRVGLGAQVQPAPANTPSIPQIVIERIQKDIQDLQQMGVRFLAAMDCMAREIYFGPIQKVSLARSGHLPGTQEQVLEYDVVLPESLATQWNLSKEQAMPTIHLQWHLLSGPQGAYSARIEITPPPQRGPVNVHFAVSSGSDVITVVLDPSQPSKEYVFRIEPGGLTAEDVAVLKNATWIGFSG